jgi:hypothetical protein
LEYPNLDFVYLRPVFIAFIVFLLALLVIVIFQNKNNLVNYFSFFSILFVCLSISSITLGSIGYIADKYGLGGDATSSYMWLVIVVLSVINSIVFLTRNNRKNINR